MLLSKKLLTYLFLFFKKLIILLFFFVLAMQQFPLSLSALTRHSDMVRCKLCVFAWEYVVLLVATAAVVLVDDDDVGLGSSFQVRTNNKIIIMYYI